MPPSLLQYSSAFVLTLRCVCVCERGLSGPRRARPSTEVKMTENPNNAFADQQLCFDYDALKNL